MKKICVCIIMMLLIIVPIVSATIPMKLATNPDISKQAIYRPPQDDIEEYDVFNLAIDGDIEILDCVQTMPVPGDFGGFPYYSIMYLTGVYFCDNPDDQTDLTLYGLRVVFAFRFTLFSAHTSLLMGSVSYYTTSGGVHYQEVAVTLMWSEWYEGCLFFRFGTQPVATNGSPLMKIVLNLDFIEDDRFIWHYGGEIYGNP